MAPILQEKSQRTCFFGGVGRAEGRPLRALSRPPPPFDVQQRPQTAQSRIIARSHTQYTQHVSLSPSLPLPACPAPLCHTPCQIHAAVARLRAPLSLSLSLSPLCTAHTPCAARTTTLPPRSASHTYIARDDDDDDDDDRKEFARLPTTCLRARARVRTRLLLFVCGSALVRTAVVAAALCAHRCAR